MRCNFEHDFLRIFVDFRGHFGTQDGAKIKEKWSDFEMMLYGGMRVIGPRNVAVEPPWRTPICAPSESKKQ